MRDKNRTVLEIKITFLHVVVFLSAVILIGIFLFYLGYQAGKTAAAAPPGARVTTAGEHIPLEQEIVSEKPSAIKDEIDIHGRGDAAVTEPVPDSQPARKVKPRPVERDSYYAVQVGAFENHAEAKSYSDLFINNNFPTEIQRVVVNEKTMYRVLVGRFDSKEEAQSAKSRMEKLAGRSGFFLRRMP
ncbi:MAG: SPOR domain-containing protein [Acidobacteriota bacterium]|jgi:cell division septation protein DedD|nr:SPOR domain-containing protein [Acidobacteriota bacterium]